MRRLVVGLLVASLVTVAHAQSAGQPAPTPNNPRDVFGLGKKPKASEPAPTPKNPRDVFGLGKKPKAEAAPVDCSDGTAFGCLGASDPLAATESIYALRTWLPASYLLRLPVASATHDTVAHYAIGASRDEAGVSFAGANGLENRWLVEGAPADGLRTGAADTRVPLTFLDGMWVTAGGFTARDRTSTGGVIDARLRRGTPEHEVESHGWLGWTAAARHRRVQPSEYSAHRGSVDAGPDAALSLVATGPIGDVLGGTAWYAVGIAPELATTKFAWTGQTITDADNDGMVDGLPGVVATERIDSYSQTPLTWRVPVMLRAGLDRGVHHADVTLLGTAATDSRFLFNSTLQAAGVDGTTFVGDAIATWRSEWSNTHLRGQFAWHRSMRRESARDPAAADLPQLLSAYVPSVLADDPVLAAACRDEPPGDKYPMVPNCPVPAGWFVSGGAGSLTDTTGDRPSLTLDAAQRLGGNVVRAGVTGEDTRLVHETHFTGGTQIRSLFPGHQSQRRFADPEQSCSSDPALPCPTVDVSQLHYRTRYTAAYVEDTWHAAPNVSVDGGVRWELMWVGPVLHFSNELSPRMGMSWDIPLPPSLTESRARMWTSMGRSFAYLPAGLGSTILQRDKTVDSTTTSLGEGRSVDTGVVTPVGSGVMPIRQDEVTLGADITLERVIQGTVWLQGRRILRGLDTTTSGFDNPGRYGGTPATRETGLFAAEIATAPTAQLVLRAGYLFGRTVGSWAGAFDPRQGAVLYAGSDFDIDPVNQLGRLPTDAGHRTYIEAQGSGSLGAAKLSIAARLTTASGAPRNVIGETIEGRTIYLIPRGSAGRSPLVSQANIRVGALWREFDITLDLFNVFNHRDALTTDETYAGGTIETIDGGSVTDLVWLKNEDGTPAARRRSYRSATSFQSPVSVVLGVSRAF